MDLSSAASLYIGKEPRGGFSLQAAPSAGRIYQIVQSERHTEPLLATFFWQIFTASPSYSRHLAQANVAPVAVQEGDAIVVGHGAAGGMEYDLIVFDPARTDVTPQVITVRPSANDLQSGWERWRNQLVPELAWRSAEIGSRRPQLQDIVESVDRNLASELAELGAFRILILKPPLIARTASAFPTPAWGVGPVGSAAGTATVGVFTTNRNGDAGVTAALHPIRNTVARLVPGATQVDVMMGGIALRGTVESVDDISDSVFVNLGRNPGPVPPPGAVVAIPGPLSGLSPRERDPVTFMSSAGPKQAFVTGWDKDIPFVRPYSQLRVYTTPVTSPGDSGVALVDSDSRVLGFAFYRTGIGEPIEYSAWVWADSVYQAHGLG